MALLVDIRNLKRIKRLQDEKMIFADLTILFVITNIKKVKLDSIIRTILGFTLQTTIRF
jgi:uncharacterized membrane protein